MKTTNFVSILLYGKHNSFIENVKIYYVKLKFLNTK